MYFKQNRVKLSLILRSIPVAAQSKANFCGLSLAEITGLNTIGDMEFCLF